MSDSTGEKTTEERVLEGERLKRVWYAGFEAARHNPKHVAPVLTVVWSGGIPEIVPNWKTGQNRVGWIS
jgi:hypothetical protein